MHLWSTWFITPNKESKGDTGFVFYSPDSPDKVSLKNKDIKVGCISEDRLGWDQRKFSG